MIIRLKITNISNVPRWRLFHLILTSRNGNELRGRISKASKVICMVSGNLSTVPGMLISKTHFKPPSHLI